MKDEVASWPVESSQQRYRDQLIAVRTDKVAMPGNSWAERTVVEHPGAVAIVAVDDQDRILMIRQYRHPVGRMLWEIPAGLRDAPGEDALMAAKRELLEETGYQAKDWRMLTDYFSSPGFSTERLRVFLARDLAEVPEGERTYVRKDEEAALTRAWVPMPAAVSAVLSGDLHNGVAAIGILAVYAAEGDLSGLRPADSPEVLGQRRSDGGAMKVGIPREVKNNEYRVAITPAGVHELVRCGHEVFIEAEAGVGSSIPDEDFVSAGAKISLTPDDVWGTADMILKVKEPVAEEYHRMRDGQVLFTYLHLAASKECTDALLTQGVTSIAYETVQLPDGSLPLLAPMSEVAGRMAPQVGAHHLQRDGGGRGVLMGGVSGVYAAKVVVLGAGVSGMNAAAIALGMQSEVLLLDKNVAKLRQADAIYQGHLQTIASNTYEVERAVLDADLVIGAVLIPGAKAPRLVTDELVARMKPGAVLVDISIDQGGCFEGSRPTTHANPTFKVHDALYYCVANMPGAVPHTSTYALTNVTLPYAVEMANRGWREALRSDPALAAGLSTYASGLTSAPVAEAHGLPSTPIASVLG